jgi:hypothetical protein
LFANKHQIGTPFTLSKNHLRRTKVKRATTTFPCSSSKFEQAARIWNSRLLDLLPVCRNPRVRIGNRFQPKGSPHQSLTVVTKTSSQKQSPDAPAHSCHGKIDKTFVLRKDFYGTDSRKKKRRMRN